MSRKYIHMINRRLKYSKPIKPVKNIPQVYNIVRSISSVINFNICWVLEVLDYIFGFLFISSIWYLSKLWVTGILLRWACGNFYSFKWMQQVNPILKIIWLNLNISNIVLSCLEYFKNTHVSSTCTNLYKILLLYDVSGLYKIYFYGNLNKT